MYDFKIDLSLSHQGITMQSLFFVGKSVKSLVSKQLRHLLDSSISVTDDETGASHFEPGALLEVGDDEAAFFSGLLFGDDGDGELNFIAGRMVIDEQGRTDKQRSRDYR